LLLANADELANIPFQRFLFFSYRFYRTHRCYFFCMKLSARFNHTVLDVFSCSAVSFIPFFQPLLAGMVRGSYTGALIKRFPAGGGEQRRNEKAICRGETSKRVADFHFATLLVGMRNR
jgi:hypothetical protein